MKKTKLALMFVAVLSMGLVGCTNDDTTSSTSSTTETGTTPVIAMITDVGNIDDGSFNQYTYEGVKQYAEEKGLGYAYYRPTEDSTTARKNSIEQAIKAGAEVVVTPGYLFEDAIYDEQTAHPETEFLLLDGEPHTADYTTYNTESNVNCILYKEDEAAYPAGYAAVMNGYTKLAFEGGMAVPAVVKYGYGFVSGALDAAIEKGVTVDITYGYAGTFAASDTIVSRCNTWYASGTEVVFSCGGSIFQSVVTAARSNSGKVIGVDVDQYSQAPDVVVTSAEKKLQKSTYEALEAYYDNNKAWPSDRAGKTLRLGAAEDMVGLPDAATSWKLENYTQDEYKALYAKMQSGEVVTNVSFADNTVTFNVNGRDTTKVNLTDDGTAGEYIPWTTAA